MTTAAYCKKWQKVVNLAERAMCEISDATIDGSRARRALDRIGLFATRQIDDAKKRDAKRNAIAKAAGTRS